MNKELFMLNFSFGDNDACTFLGIIHQIEGMIFLSSYLFSSDNCFTHEQMVHAFIVFLRKFYTNCTSFG